MPCAYDLVGDVGRPRGQLQVAKLPGIVTRENSLVVLDRSRLEVRYPRLEAGTALGAAIDFKLIERKKIAVLS